MAERVSKPDSAPRSWRWPAAIVTLLCVHAIGMGVTVFIATRDPSFAVEPHSYKKAVTWDSARAERRASDALGWVAAIDADAATDLLGRRKVRCELKDHQGVPVMAAMVTLEVFHHARAAERLSVALDAQDHGVYTALVPMKRAGTWELRLTARRGAETFSEVVTREVGGKS
jgi:nitrogen fixation protein FixH